MDTEIKNVINEKTKISFLIKANPLVIETLARFNPHFNKLKNPILRNLLAPRVNISEACKIGGCKVDEFMEKMAEIGFIIDRSTVLPTPGSDVEEDAIFFKNIKSTIELDVRPILAGKQDPLKLIIQSANGLKPGQCLKIINSFEPVPLINMLAKKGFQHFAERPETEVVITYFIKSIDHPPLDDPFQDDLQYYNNTEFDRMLQLFDPSKIHTVDVRELEMPLPMITILEQLKEVRSDEALFVYHKKVPVFLLPELKERGFGFLIKNTPDNKVNMLIFRP